MSATAERKRSIFDDSDDDDKGTDSQEAKKSKRDTKEEPRQEELREKQPRQEQPGSKKGSRGQRGKHRQGKRVCAADQYTKDTIEEGKEESAGAKRGRRGQTTETRDRAPQGRSTNNKAKPRSARGKRGQGNSVGAADKDTKDTTEDAKEESAGTKTDVDSRQAIEPPGTPEKTEGESAPEKLTLSPAQRARMEQKRQHALMLKQERMNRKNPYYMKTEEKKSDSKVVRINNTKLIDTGSGFFIEEVDGLNQDDFKAAMQMVSEPVQLFEDEKPRCEECNNKFNSSFLFKNFDHHVCDNCRDSEDKHTLITKTDARNEYLLKDVDLEKRKPILKFIMRKNPHNSRWGDMKLYLKLQVEKRALELWGSEEALEEAMTKKEDQQVINKQKKFNKKMKELRMNVRSSLYTRATNTHKHEYGEEEYLADEDEYSRTCLTCGHSYTYDKL